MAGTYTYTKRWDRGGTALLPGGLPKKHGSILIFEQTLAGGIGNGTGTLLRDNDADVGVPIPSGLKRLALVIRVDSQTGGAATDKLSLSIDLKPALATRFYHMYSANTTSRFIGGGTIAANSMEVWNMDGRLTTGGGAFREYQFPVPATEASAITDAKNQIGFPVFACSDVRVGWAYTHPGSAAGSWGMTVQMWGIYDQ